MEVFEVFLSDKVLTVIGLHNVYRSCDDGLSGAQYLTFVEYTLLKQLLPQHENIYFALEIFHRSFRILTLALAVPHVMQISVPFLTQFSFTLWNISLAYDGGSFLFHLLNFSLETISVIYFLEYPTPAARHKKRHMAISQEPSVVS